MQVKTTLALAVAVALTGCGPPGATRPPKHRLEGSLTQVMDLGYDTVKVFVAPEDVAVVFSRLRPQVFLDGGMTAENEDIILRFSFELWGEPEARANIRYDLDERNELGEQRGRVARNVFNDPRTTFPELRVGSVKFDKAIVEGASVFADFNLTFENGIEAASGRTVFGTFRARVYR